jgi:ribosomal protein L40E
MSSIDAGEPSTECSACHAFYHAECWDENGGCAVYGCAQVPKTEGLKALEIPPAFWGREDKDCPQCGAKIMALAVRCRHCGGQIEARPESKDSFERRSERRLRAPTQRRFARLFMVLSLLPALSLLTLSVGTIYYRRNREEIRRLSGGTDGLFRIAFTTAAAQCALLLLGLVGWWIKFVVFD